MDNLDHMLADADQDALFETLGRILYGAVISRVPGLPETDLLTEADRAFAYCKKSVLSYSEVGELMGHRSYTWVANRVKNSIFIEAEKGMITALSVYRYALAEDRKKPMNIFKIKK